MNYTVQVTATAKAEADAAFQWLHDRGPAHAAGWFNGLVDAVERLATFPARWSLARESSDFDEEIRQMLYGRKPHVYRVLFIVRGRTVYVLHIRHGARQAIAKSDVVFPDPDVVR